MMSLRFFVFLGGIILSQVELMAGDIDQMAFLHLRWESNSVTLLSSEVRPGRLKAPAPGDSRHRIQLSDAQGRPLWQSPLTDPRTTRYEFPAQAAPSGAIASRTVTAGSAECVVRVPVRADGAEVLILSGPSPAVGPAPAGLNVASATNTVILARFPAPKPAPRP